MEIFPVLFCLWSGTACLPMIYPMVMEEIEGPGVLVHAPNGQPVLINPKQIRVIRQPLSTEPGNATIIFSTGAHQSTKETVEEIYNLIAKEKQQEKGGYSGGP